MIVKINKYIIEDSKNLDVSGEYHDLYHFINDNKLQLLFSKLYDIDVRNWNDYVYGELGSDEEIIENILNNLNNKYKLFYDEEYDVFIIKLKQDKKYNIEDFKIIKTNSKEVLKVLEQSGIYSDYKPRFAVYHNDKMIAATTYYVNEDNKYLFDIGVLEVYQGGGIGKILINKIIEDAKKLKADEITARVVNNELLKYLQSIGFKKYKSDKNNYVFMKHF